MELDNRMGKLREQWRSLPPGKQRRYTRLLFAGYALLSLFVIARVCYDTGSYGNDIQMEHIRNPVIPQKKSAAAPRDSLSIILKNNMYERK
ncbi:MAG: nitrogen regulatory IIA protein [Chitinophagaceae bacterium]